MRLHLKLEEDWYLQPDANKRRLGKIFQILQSKLFR